MQGYYITVYKIRLAIIALTSLQALRLLKKLAAKSSYGITGS